MLRALIDVFLSKNSRSGGSEQTNKMSELAVAIQNNAKKSKNRRFYYAQVLGCLSRGELIDFDAIGSAEAGVDAASKDAAIAYSSASVEIVKNEVDSTDFTRGMPAAGKFAPRELLLSAELLSAAAHTTGVALTAAQFDSLKWKFIDAYLTETGGLYNAGYFCRQYAETLLRQVGANDARQFRDAFIRALLQNSLPSTRDLARRLADLLADESEAFSDPDATAVPASAEPVDETAALETIYIANAGAVLLAPYLPLLFERLGLTEKGQFRNRDAAERGVHCLQFLVDESSSSPEFQLVLNKLLCGVRPGRPIRRSIELANDEKEQLEGLLRAIIENWRALGNTSVAGLRESFLQRNGRLQLENNAWRLSVEARPFDMLLDQLPWSFSAIKFAWMDRVIYTEWR